MEGTGLLAVARDLGLQLVEAGECKVAAQAAAERDPHPPAIQVAATLQQVDLEQQAAAVEGRAATEIGCRRMPGPADITWTSPASVRPSLPRLAWCVMAPCRT